MLSALDAAQSTQKPICKEIAISFATIVRRKIPIAITKFLGMISAMLKTLKENQDLFLAIMTIIIRPVGMVGINKTKRYLKII